MQIRESRPEDDERIAAHFFAMWRDNGIAAERICADWESRVAAFVLHAREHLAYRAFVAESDTGAVIGSASCQLFAGLYPNVLESVLRKYGYVWGVYVEPDVRRRSVGRLLTRASTEYLKSIGCTHALLHASPPGRPVYAALGFEGTNEMRLVL